MADVAFVCVILGMFTLAFGLLRLCERTVGGGVVAMESPPDARPAEVVA